MRFQPKPPKGKDLKINSKRIQAAAKATGASGKSQGNKEGCLHYYQSNPGKVTDVGTDPIERNNLKSHPKQEIAFDSRS